MHSAAGCEGVGAEAPGATESTPPIGRPAGASRLRQALSTVPAYSAPGTKGKGGLIWYLFWTIRMSGKFRLAALISMSTSPASGSWRGQFFPVQGIYADGVFTKPGMHGASPNECVQIIGLNVSQGVAWNVPTATSAREAAHLQCRHTLFRHENSHFQRRRLPGGRHRGAVRSTAKTWPKSKSLRPSRTTVPNRMR